MTLSYYDLIGATANKVSVLGTEVTRPSFMSPKQWLDFWDDVKLNPLHLEAEEENSAKLEAELKLKDVRIKQLEGRVRDQAAQVARLRQELARYRGE